MSILERLAAWIPGQWEKVIITVLLIGMALLALHLWARYLARGEISAEKRRIHPKFSISPHPVAGGRGIWPLGSMWRKGRQAVGGRAPGRWPRAQATRRGRGGALSAAPAAWPRTAKPGAVADRSGYVQRSPVTR